MEIIHMTAAYSNAVLVAFLPLVSDFAKKLNLPVKQPVTMDQVVWAHVSPVKTEIHCGLRLTNNYWFGCGPGAVINGFRCPRIAMLDEDPRKNWPKYAFGKSNMSTNEAIQLARDAIKKLGYSLETLHANGSPTKIEGPYDLDDGKYHMPECIIKWEGKLELFQGFVHLGRKELLGLYLASRVVSGPDPKIDIVPELERDYRARMRQQQKAADPPAEK